MKLAEFQALFQARVMAGGGTADKPLLERLRPSPRGAPGETLLNVYQNGYRARLADFLDEDHPGLRALLGDEAFDELVEDYIASCPARDPNARWFTTGLPDFMRANKRWRDNAPAISMALLERAMVDAFDSADAEPLRIEALAQFAPEDWPRLAFALHPSLTLLELSAGTLAAYGGEPDEEREGAAAVEHAAIWRIEHESAYRALEPEEFVALSEARAGRAFGDICQMAAFQQQGEMSAERLAQFLASWFEDGMVAAAAPER